MTGVINVQGYYPMEKSVAPLTEVVFCYMSDRQERFGLLLFCSENVKRGHVLSGNIFLISF